METQSFIKFVNRLKKLEEEKSMRRETSGFIQMKRSKYIAVMFLVFLAGVFGVSITGRTSVDLVLEENRDLKVRVDSLGMVIKGIEVFETQVVATMYKPHSVYTDDDPHILADGTEINIWKVKDYRYVGLSRDLLARWGGPFNYGDSIVVEGAGEHDGVWEVRDSMAPRWTRRIDFLMPLGTPIFKYENVTIRKQVASTGETSIRSSES